MTKKIKEKTLKTINYNTFNDKEIPLNKTKDQNKQEKDIEKIETFLNNFFK